MLELSSQAAVACRVRVADVLPRWLAPYWHTLRLLRNGTLLAGHGTPNPIDQALEGLVILPAASRPPPSPVPAAALQPLGMAAGAASASAHGGSHLLSFTLRVPPHTQVLLVLDFAKHVRHIDLAPADASRGLDVAPAAVCVEAAGASSADVTANASGRCGESSPAYWVYTEAAVVPVPIADASMPFNVMAITGTLVSLFVGSMFNSLVAR